MIDGMDVHSIYARSIRAHIRVALRDLMAGIEPSNSNLRRFLKPEQSTAWGKALGATASLIREQQSASYAAMEAVKAGYLAENRLSDLIADGVGLRRHLDALAKYEAKLGTYKSTNASWLKVAHRKAAIDRRRILELTVLLEQRVVDLSNVEWDYVELASPKTYNWLIKWKEDQDFAPLPFELVREAEIKLLEQWISEWDHVIDEYESIDHKSIK